MRIKYYSILTALCAAVNVAAGCAPAFSPEILDKVDRNITFRELYSDPDRYRGTWVMLGGVIVETRNTKEGTFIEVLQTPVSRQGRPRETDATVGRFIISSPQFLDSAVYARGKMVTVVGEVAGFKVQPLGELEYRYPVITARETRLWEPREPSRFSFGVGVGVFHRL